MRYTLHRLAAGSYDLELNGEVIGGLVRTEISDRVTWTAELLKPLPSKLRPAPFTNLEHEFQTFGAAVDWLGTPEVREAS